MAERILERIHGRPSEIERKTSEEELETEDAGAFGFLRGVKDRSIMLELRMKSGSVIALSYSWLEAAEYDPSTGITLKFGSRKVHIAGRNLNAEIRPNVQLYSGIVRHRVCWIQEAGLNAQLLAPKSMTTVDKIKVE